MSGLVTNYTCLCTERYGGVNCQYALCFEGYCQNDGVCRVRYIQHFQFTDYDFYDSKPGVQPVYGN